MNSNVGRVLFVDDDPSIREIFRRSVAGAGYHVDVASTADEARQRARERRYDLIVADLVLHEQNGLDVLHDVGPIQPQAGLILVSAQFPSNGNMQVDGRQISVLAKPWEPDLMLEALATAKPVEVAAVAQPHTRHL